MRKVGGDEYREHADYRRADAIKQLKADKNQWICSLSAALFQLP
jgi:hypothetical protein